MKKALVVLPTYNERENIELILDAILSQQANIATVELHVLVVDDSSPDGTGAFVAEYIKKQPTVHLLTGKKEGLGKAYIRGFAHGMNVLNADIIMEMDADFSHDPAIIPSLISKINDGYDFVIGSRYVDGGSIPENWPYLRKLNSRCANLVSRMVAGIGGVHDATGGFRAIDVTLLKRMDLDELAVKGYAFQISLLHNALLHGARVFEVPISFVDRARGQSKIRISDAIEFVKCSVVLRFKGIKHFVAKNTIMIVSGLVISLVAAVLWYVIVYSLIAAFLIGLTVVASIFLALQGILTLVWMYYAWSDANRAENNKSPRSFSKPTYSFTAILPARHEEQVIFDTVTSVAGIDYPEELKETLVICRADDVKTIAEVERAIQYLGKSNVRLAVHSDFPINKPHGLNCGLAEAKNEVVAVFDAEDEPHRDIYNIINTVMLRDSSDVVQSGVQLMNHKSNWFSTFNVLEYFFWFKSALHFFANVGLIPLGGNTVFFKRAWLNKVGGWDEQCLTEDADIGIRLSLAGAKIRIVYDETHVTREETPPSLPVFINQRTRWNQGFIQIFMKGDWKRLPKLSQRFLACYILLGAEIQTFMFIYIPITLYIMLRIKLPILVALISFAPFYILILQLLTYNIGLYQFTRDYKQRYSLLMVFKTIVTFYPFQIVLGYSAIRAIYRLVRKNISWEKTLHVNAHRDVAIPVVAPVYVVESTQQS